MVNYLATNRCDMGTLRSKHGVKQKRGGSHHCYDFADAQRWRWGGGRSLRDVDHGDMGTSEIEAAGQSSKGVAASLYDVVGRPVGGTGQWGDPDECRRVDNGHNLTKVSN